MKASLILLLKIIVASGALYLVLYNADLAQINYYLHAISPWYLVLSLLATFISQALSGLRLHYYLTREKLPVTRYYATALYFVGAFFNLVSPGGIGGDGYKVIVLSRLPHPENEQERFSAMLALKRVISSRGSGMLVLALMAGVLILVTDAASLHIPTLPWLNGWMIASVGLLLCIPCYLIVIKWLLDESPAMAWGACQYSFGVQLFATLAALFLFIGLGIHEYPLLLEYTLLFLVSSLVSILPISIGGIGLREVTFFYGAPLLALEPEKGVAFSILFFCVNSIVALTGTYFWFTMKRITPFRKGL